MNNFSDKIVIAFIVVFFLFLIVVIVLIQDKKVAVRTDGEKKEVEFKVGM